jgi:hypothetical protein
MRWRCGNCGSRLTEFIVGGSHMRPREPVMAKPSLISAAPPGRRRAI